MSISYNETFADDFDCDVENIADLITLRTEIKSRRSNLPVLSTEHSGVRMHITTDGEVAIS